MLNFKDIIIKHCELKLSGRQIASSLGVSKSGVNDFLKAFNECGKLSYPLPEGITNYAIAQLVYGKPQGNNSRDTSFELPDFAFIHKQITSRNNMTIVYLWNKYKQRCKVEEKKFYQYRQFCELYSRWCEENYETFHFTAVIGQKMEVDFAGKVFHMVDRLTGELIPIVVFVAVLPYSQYIYAEGMLSTKEPQWIKVNNSALEYFGSVPQIVVCDNCKQAVLVNKDWIEPILNKDYAEWAEHNNTVILPAKVKKPKFKSSVENAVGILEKGLFHDLEEGQYFSLEEFNEALWIKIAELNRSDFAKRDHNRLYYWEEERQELTPLPSTRYEYLERKIVKVSSDFHVRFDSAYYSVDKRFLHQKILLKASTSMVKFYSLEGVFICEWPRSVIKGQWMTNPEHLPDIYKNFSEWNATTFTRQALAVGPCTNELIQRVLKCRKYEVQTYRMCVGILSFSRKYSKPALEECCKQALEHNKTTYTFVKNTIALIAEEMGSDGYNTHTNEERNKGGFTMGAGAMALDKLLSRSSELVHNQENGGEE